MRAVRDPATIAWLTWLCEWLGDDDPRWGFSPYQFRTCLNDAARFFGIGNFGFGAASLRAGGATFLMERGVPVGQIRFEGSWASERTLGAYLQEAAAAATLIQVSGRQADLIENCFSELNFASWPPPISYADLLRSWISDVRRTPSGGQAR